MANAPPNSRPDPDTRSKPAPPPEAHKKSNKYHRRIVQFIDELKPRNGRQSEDTLGMFDIIVKSMGIMENTITDAQLKIHAPDILIEIPRDTCSFYEFYRARELIEIGRQKTEAILLPHHSLSAPMSMKSTMPRSNSTPNVGH